MLFGLAIPLLLVGVVVAVVISQQHHHHDSMYRATGPAPARTAGAGPVPATAMLPSFVPPSDAPPPARLLGHDLDRWVEAGLITIDQADAIRAHEQGRLAAATAPPSPRRIPAVAEALGYLGGVLGIAGLSVAIGRYWSDLTAAGRLGLSVGAAAVLVLAGALVHEESEPALARLRGFLWLIGTAAAGLAAGVVAHDLIETDRVGTIVLTVATAVTVLSGVLWWWRDRPLQQFTCLGGLLVTVGTAVQLVGGSAVAIGGALWLTAVAFLVVGPLGLTPNAWMTTSIGAIGAIVGAQITATEINGSTGQGPGLVFTVLTALALIGLAVSRRLAIPSSQRVALAVIGGVAALQIVPATVGWFAQDAGIATGLVVWAAGGGLLFVAVRGIVRAPVLIEVLGGLAVVAGAAITGTQSVAFATTFGLLTAIALLALGMLPGRVLMSVFGSLGLLVNVPWAIGYWFPGEGRVPLLIAVSGLLLILVAVLLTRMSGRFRSELRD